jgi:hypothetical protein
VTHASVRSSYGIRRGCGLRARVRKAAQACSKYRSTHRIAAPRLHRVKRRVVPRDAAVDAVHGQPPLPLHRVGAGGGHATNSIHLRQHLGVGHVRVTGTRYVEQQRVTAHGGEGRARARRARARARTPFAAPDSRSRCSPWWTMGEGLPSFPAAPKARQAKQVVESNDNDTTVHRGRWAATLAPTRLPSAAHQKAQETHCGGKRGAPVVCGAPGHAGARATLRSFATRQLPQGPNHPPPTHPVASSAGTGARCTLRLLLLLLCCARRSRSSRRPSPSRRSRSLSSSLPLLLEPDDDEPLAQRGADAAASAPTVRPAGSGLPGESSRRK